MKVLTVKTRSSHRRCSVKKRVLKNVAKFTGKNLCQTLFFNKVAGLRQFLKLVEGGNVKFSIYFLVKTTEVLSENNKRMGEKEIFCVVIRDFRF